MHKDNSDDIDMAYEFAKVLSRVVQMPNNVGRAMCYMKN
jgi:hypothetical protein